MLVAYLCPSPKLFLRIGLLATVGAFAALAKLPGKPALKEASKVAPKAVAKPMEDSVALFALDPSKAILAQDWEGGFLNDGEKGYQILTDKGRPFIRASYTPGQRLEYLYRTVDWPIKTRPLLAWRWRVQKFPPNGKVLDMARSDAAAQIYIVWSLGMRKNVIKYYWGVNDGVGDEIKQSNFFAGKLWGKILRNGPPWGDWQRQVRNVLEDYRKNFNEEPPEHVGAIAIMSDGDDSKGDAEADFADFRVLPDPAAKVVVEPPEIAPANAKEPRLSAPCRSASGRRAW